MTMKTVFGVEKLMDSVAYSGPSDAVRVTATHRVFQAAIRENYGGESAVVDIEVSLDNENWLKQATISLSGSTPFDGFATSAPWPYVRAFVTFIEGGVVDVFVGV